MTRFGMNPFGKPLGELPGDDAVPDWFELSARGEGTAISTKNSEEGLQDLPEGVASLRRVGRFVLDVATLDGGEGVPAQQVARAIRHLAKLTGGGQRGLPSGAGEEFLGGSKRVGHGLDFSPEIFLCVVGELVLSSEIGAERHHSLLTALNLIDSYIGLYRESEYNATVARVWIKEELENRGELRTLCSLLCERLQADSRDPGLSGIAGRLLEKMVWIYGEPVPTSSHQERGHISREELLDLLGDSLVLVGFLPPKLRGDGEELVASMLPLGADPVVVLVQDIPRELRNFPDMPIIPRSFLGETSLGHYRDAEELWREVQEIIALYWGSWSSGSSESSVVSTAFSSDGRWMACCPPSIPLNGVIPSAPEGEWLISLPLIFTERIGLEGGYYPVRSLGLLQEQRSADQVEKVHPSALIFVPNSDSLAMIPSHRQSIWIFSIGEDSSWSEHPLPKALAHHDGPLKLCAIGGVVGVVALRSGPSSSLPIHWIKLAPDQEIAAGLRKNPLLLSSDHSTGYLGADSVQTCLLVDGLNLGTFDEEVHGLLKLRETRLPHGKLLVQSQWGPGGGDSEIYTREAGIRTNRSSLKLVPTEGCFLSTKKGFGPDGPTEARVLEADPRVIGQILLRTPAIPVPEQKVTEDFSEVEEHGMSVALRSVRKLLEEAQGLIQDNPELLSMTESQFLAAGDSGVEVALTAEQRGAIALQDLALAAGGLFREIVDDVRQNTHGWSADDGVAFLREAFQSGEKYHLNKEFLATLEICESLHRSLPSSPAASVLRCAQEAVNDLTALLRDVVPETKHPSPLRTLEELRAVLLPMLGTSGEGKLPHLEGEAFANTAQPEAEQRFQKMVGDIQEFCLRLAKPSQVLPLLDMFHKSQWPLDDKIAKEAFRRADPRDLPTILTILKEGGYSGGIVGAIRERIGPPGEVYADGPLLTE